MRVGMRNYFQDEILAFLSVERAARNLLKKVYMQRDGGKDFDRLNKDFDRLNNAICRIDRLRKTRRT